METNERTGGRGADGGRMGGGWMDGWNGGWADARNGGRADGVDGWTTDFRRVKLLI